MIMESSCQQKRAPTPSRHEANNVLIKDSLYKQESIDLRVLSTYNPKGYFQHIIQKEDMSKQ